MNTNNRDINFDSVENQDIKRNFVENNVLCDISSLMESLILLGYEGNNIPFEIEEISKPLYSYTGQHISFYDESYEQKEALIEELREKIDNDSNITDEELESIEYEIKEAENYSEESYPEIFCWYAVSSYLADKLAELGEIVVDCGSCYAWGRTTFGQAILLDGVINEICLKNDWLK